jgi:hypothetical protein
MSEKNISGESYHHHQKTTTTGTANGVDDNSVDGTNGRRAESDNYASAPLSSLHDYDSMPFASQFGFDFPMGDNDINSLHVLDNSETLSVDGRNETQRVPSVSVASLPAAPAASSHSIPEFLFQLTKMLTENNSDVIEWSMGKIKSVRRTFLRLHH